MRFQLVVNGEAHEVETDGAVRVDGRPVAGEATLDGRGVTVRIGRNRYRVLITRWGSVVDDVPYRVEVRSLQEGTGRGVLQPLLALFVEYSFHSFWRFARSRSMLATPRPVLVK